MRQAELVLASLVVSLGALAIGASAPQVVTQSLAQISPQALGSLEVLSVSPPSISSAVATTNVAVRFDRPVDPATIDAASFRVAGRWSGTKSGSYSLAQGGRLVTFDPSTPFSAGEGVSVNLSHDIRGADGKALRSAGYAYHFGISAVPTAANFQELDVLSNTTGEQTRIYGASASDLNNDGYLDLTTVNEVSADLRVFMNVADGSGNYGSFLTPTPIGIEASPNEPADFDNDGNADLCVAAASSDSVWICLGAGDGSYASVQEIAVGSEPHGIVSLDVDGDGDLDVVNAARVSNDLALMLNDGNGVFGSPAFFEGGVDGEYGLAAGDMNADGILDLVVAGRGGSHIAVRLGNGNGTFTSAGPAQPCGGPPWVVVLGDVNGDGKLDANVANSFSGNASILIGNGSGQFVGMPALLFIGSHVPATDLADLDGDGDLDCVISSFGGGFWRVFQNNGSGSFTFWWQIDAPSNPSCAVPLDFDNDGDVDLALSDEIADVIVLMKNQ